MPKSCTVCAHPLREKIEKAVARGRSVRWLAGEYGLTKSAIQRHKRHPLPGWLTDKQLVTVLAGERKSMRGNPDKTKAYRWKPGQSGNPRGRSSTPRWTMQELIREAIAGDLRAVMMLSKLEG
jgi:hypothetical protein